MLSWCEEKEWCVDYTKWRFKFCKRVKRRRVLGEKCINSVIYIHIIAWYPVSVSSVSSPDNRYAPPAVAPPLAYAGDDGDRRVANEIPIDVDATFSINSRRLSIDVCCSWALMDEVIPRAARDDIGMNAVDSWQHIATPRRRRSLIMINIRRKRSNSEEEIKPFISTKEWWESRFLIWIYRFPQGGR